MVRTDSVMVPLGTKAPDFALLDTDGTLVRRSDLEGKPLVVVFMCNHCPYVKHVAPRLAELAREYQEQGVAVVGISSNDAETYPDDGPQAMKEEKQMRGYTFPYLFDETQEVAKAYKAACTPDLFVFDAEHTLVYRGQMDDSRPGNDHPVTGADLTKAVKAVAAGGEVPEQKASLGCNIKWKPGNEPSYFRSG